MKAMLLRGPNLPFEPVELPDPMAGPGEAVARVITCGSGLTIQHVKAGRRPVQFPRVIGHEITAEIGNVGLECDGGYAEYIKLPAHIFIKLPEALDWRAHPAEIGVITDALATPYKVLRRAHVAAGETVAVIGAGGGVGIHQVMMAKWANARVIAVDVAADKFAACRKAGADAVIDPRGIDLAAALRDATDGNGVDVVVDYVCTTATLEAGVNALGRRGRLVILGGAAEPFRLPAREMLLKELDVLGSRYVTRAEILETFAIVARGEVRPLVTDIRPLEEAEAVHERVERGEVTGRAALRVAA